MRADGVEETLTDVVRLIFLAMILLLSSLRGVALARRSNLWSSRAEIALGYCLAMKY